MHKEFQTRNMTNPFFKNSSCCLSSAEQGGSCWTKTCSNIQTRNPNVPLTLILFISFLYENALNLLPQKASKCVVQEKVQKKYSFCQSDECAGLTCPAARSGGPGPLTTPTLFFTSSQNACVFLCVITGSPLSPPSQRA